MIRRRPARFHAAPPAPRLRRRVSARADQHVFGRCPHAMDPAIDCKAPVPPRSRRYASRPHLMPQPTRKYDQGVGLRHDVDERRCRILRIRARRQPVKPQLTAAEAARRRREIVHERQDADAVELLQRVDVSVEMAAVAVRGKFELARLAPGSFTWSSASAVGTIARTTRSTGASNDPSSGKRRQSRRLRSTVPSRDCRLYASPRSKSASRAATKCKSAATVGAPSTSRKIR